MKLKAVFFDAGETLIYRNPSLAAITLRMLRSSGYRVSRPAAESAIGRAAAGMRAIVSRGKLTDSQKWSVYMKKVFSLLKVKDNALLEKIKMRLKSGSSFRPYADGIALLDYLNKKGIVTGIISNAPRELLVILKRSGIVKRVKHVIISEAAGVEKPHRKIFDFAVKKAGVSRRSFMYVGDNYLADIKGALGAGLAAAWVLRRSTTSHFSYKHGNPHESVPVLKDLNELKELIEREKWIR